MSRYTINNIEYPSVSEILSQLDKSDALIPWAVNLACEYIRQAKPKESELEVTLQEAKIHYKDISQQALDIGSEVHHAISDYIKTKADKRGEFSDQVASALIAFFDWEKEHDVKWIESEMVVVNDIDGYAGTEDALAIVDGILTLIDFKSSKAIYPEYIMQVCAYRSARRNMRGKYTVSSPSGESIVNVGEEYISIDAVGILRLDKITGLPEWKHITDMKVIKRQTMAFISLVEYYYYVKNRRLKNNPLVDVFNDLVSR